MRLLRLFVPLLLSGTLFAQCENIFKYGLYDFHSTATDDERATSFVNWACSQHSSSMQAGADVGIPIDDVPVKLGGTFGNSGSDLSCNSNAGQDNIKKAYLVQSATIDGKATGAYEKCISSKGLHEWMETTADPHVVLLVINVNPIEDGQVAKVRSFTQSGATCKPQLRKGDPIGISGFSSICTRQDTKQAVVLNLNTNMSTVDRGPMSMAGTTFPEPSCCGKSWVEYILDGNPVYLLTSPTVNQPDNCLGSILPSSVYTIAYEKAKTGWYGEGPHGDGTCPTKTRDYIKNDSYNCANFANLCGLTPDKNVIVLWGGDLYFDQEGRVYRNTAPGTRTQIGELMRDHQGAFSAQAMTAR